MGFYEKWVQVSQETEIHKQPETDLSIDKNKLDVIFPNHLPPLPTDCPMVDGGACPPGCRFETKFLCRMIEEGSLPDPETGCPLRGVCGLFSEWPRQERQPSPLRCLGHDCEYVARNPETASLRCEKADAEVIDMTACPNGKWSRDLPRPTKQIGTPHGAPGDCEHCPACDKETMMCHFAAYYLHKSGRPAPCSQIRMNCPRKDKSE